MRTSGWLLIVGLLLVPMHTWAMQEHVYEFRSGNINAEWKGNGPIQMQKHAEGIILSTGSATGAILTRQEPDFLADIGTITLTSDVSKNVLFGWVLDSDHLQTTYAVQADYAQGAYEQATFSLGSHNYWIDGKKQMGLIIPPHTTILLHSITLQHWNIAEKLWSGLVSFWTLDAYRPYSINFLWGPQFQPMPTQRGEIFYNLPPLTVSWTLIVYCIILLALGIIIMSARKPVNLRQIAKKIAIVFLVGWLLLDLRMGSEFLSWVKHDAVTYGMAQPGERTLRDRDAFYDFGDFVTPLVEDRKSYIFLANYPWPYLGNIRYITYPSLPGIAYDKDDTWVIYQRPDVRISPEMHLLIDGQIVAGPGTVLGVFDDASFVYRASPPLPSVKQ